MRTSSFTLSAIPTISSIISFGTFKSVRSRHLLLSFYGTCVFKVSRNDCVVFVFFFAWYLSLYIGVPNRTAFPWTYITNASCLRIITTMSEFFTVSYTFSHIWWLEFVLIVRMISKTKTFKLKLKLKPLSQIATQFVKHNTHYAILDSQTYLLIHKRMLLQ